MFLTQDITCFWHDTLLLNIYGNLWWGREEFPLRHGALINRGKSSQPTRSYALPNSRNINNV